MRFGSLLIAAGGLAGALAVALGAIGAHVLEPRLLADDYATFTLGADYLLIHAIVLCGCGAAAERAAGRLPFQLAGGLCLAGIVLFCGGLMGSAAFGMPVLTRVAPVGGSAFILAWLAITLGGIVNFWHTR